MLTSLSLLLVDDDSEFIEIIARLLSRNGATVRICTQAATALEAVHDDCPDLAMLDRKIGRDDGLELARHLRSLEPSMPIIMLSGFSGEVAIAQAIAAGVTRYLTKPLSLADMKTAVFDIVHASGLLPRVRCRAS